MEKYAILISILVVCTIIFFYSLRGLKKNFEIVKKELENNQGGKPMKLITMLYFGPSVIKGYFTLVVLSVVCFIVVAFLAYNGVL